MIWAGMATIWAIGAGLVWAFFAGAKNRQHKELRDEMEIRDRMDEAPDFDDADDAAGWLRERQNRRGLHEED